MFENEEDRKVHTEHYLPKVEIKEYNVMIDGKNDQPVKNSMRAYDVIRKIATGQEFKNQQFDLNNIEIDAKSYKNILISYIEYVTGKDLKSVKINSVNPLYLIFSKVNGYFEELNESEYLTLVPTNKSKEKIKKYEEMQSKIKDLVRSITKNSVDYDEKYMKIKFYADSELPLNKTIEIPTMAIVFTAVFHENNKYYQQVFLEKCLYKL